MLTNRLMTIVLLSMVLLSCKTQKKVNDMSVQKQITDIDFSSGPAALIYKTNNDYYNNVPVILSDDKTKIVSYPNPNDIYYNGALAYPIKLEDGYLLDNRGISANVAFLNITYEEYSNLENTPSADSLFNLIENNNPLTELYDCGNRYQYKNEEQEFNKMIKKKQLVKCKRLVRR